MDDDDIPEVPYLKAKSLVVAANRMVREGRAKALAIPPIPKAPRVPCELVEPKDMPRAKIVGPASGEHRILRFELDVRRADLRMLIDGVVAVLNAWIPYGGDD